MKWQEPKEENRNTGGCWGGGGIGKLKKAAANSDSTAAVATAAADGSGKAARIQSEERSGEV